MIFLKWSTILSIYLIQGITTTSFGDYSTQNTDRISPKDSLINSIEMGEYPLEEFELKGLYPTQTIIPQESEDKLMLVKELKALGFRQSNAGRGNWEHGPRIISVTLEKTGCNCRVDKLYYSLKEENNFEVSERIICWLTE